MKDALEQLRGYLATDKSAALESNNNRMRHCCFYFFISNIFIQGKTIQYKHCSSMGPCHTNKVSKQTSMHTSLYLHTLRTWDKFIFSHISNKANLRDLITATGLVILLKLDSNRRFSARVTLKFDGWPRKTIRHLFYATLSFLHHFVAIGEFKLE